MAAGIMPLLAVYVRPSPQTKDSVPISLKRAIHAKHR